VTRLRPENHNCEMSIFMVIHRQCRKRDFKYPSNTLPVDLFFAM
jgi:hypothetical protein